MRKPFDGDYPITPGRYFGAPETAYDRLYGAHKGIDYMLPIGIPLFAAMAGTVTYAGWATDAGYTVTIKAGTTLVKYFHLSEVRVRLGQFVNESALIGKSGNSGNTAGPHLHFQVEVPEGNPVDPTKLFRQAEQINKVLGATTNMKDYNSKVPSEDVRKFYKGVLIRDPENNAVLQGRTYGELYEGGVKELRIVLTATQQQVEQLRRENGELRAAQNNAVVDQLKELNATLKAKG